jgi:hypothetical protein
LASLRRGARDVDLVLHQRLVAHHLAAEDEGVAGTRPSMKYSSIWPSIRPPRADGTRRAGRLNAPAHQPHLQHRLFDDGADVEPVAAAATFGLATRHGPLVLLDAAKRS